MAESKANGVDVKAVICCACGQQCGVLVHVDHGRVVRVAGDKEHPISKGFICIKGTNATEMLYSHDRVNWPLKRTGRRGEGKWRRIGWDDALGEIAEKIKALTAQHGPETVATTTGTIHGADWGMSERFLNLLGSPNIVGQDKVCTGPLAIGETITYGLGPTGFGRPVAGLTKCVVLWGMHPSASRPLLWSGIVEARRAGAKLIVVDPLRSSEARQADLFVQHRPGTDAALALGWLNVIINEGLYDEEFVRSRTSGFEELKQRASEYPPSRVAEITWTPEETITQAARMYALNAPAMLTASNGLCQIGRTAVQAARAIACLIAVTGNLERPGGHHIAGPPRKIIGNGSAVLAHHLSDGQRDKRIGGERFPLLGGPSFRKFDSAMARRWYGQRNILSSFSSAHEPMLWRAI
ncbi:MAG: molybdopterin-dependent oxidoreductase [Candidatus Binataceae bacterium]